MVEELSKSGAFQLVLGGECRDDATSYAQDTVLYVPVAGNYTILDG